MNTASFLQSRARVHVHAPQAATAVNTLSRGPRGKQAGYLMLEVSLALIITAIAAIGTMRASSSAARMEAYNVEADKIKVVQSALQKYTDDNYPALQKSLPVSKNGTTVPNGAGVGQTRKPSVAQLLAMDYLPTGFANNSALIDGATYENEIKLEPAGCVTIACNVRGFAYLSAPLRLRGTAFTDNSAIGQILVHIGGEAGTSVEGTTNVIRSAGAGWVWANPMAGNPAGVIGARFGIDSSNFNNFVRINDSRDPALQGNLSALGNLAIGGTSTLAGAVTANGGMTVNGAPGLTVSGAGGLNVTGGASTLKGNVAVVNAANTTCVDIQRTGVVTINCTGSLNSKNGTFTDGSGNTVTITPGGITATDTVSATNGFRSTLGSIFASGEPTTIRVNAGQMFLFGNGGRLAAFDNGDIVAQKSLAGQMIGIGRTVVAGAACAAGEVSAINGAVSQYASMAGGGLAFCNGASWVSLNNRSTANSACAPNGSIATDTATGEGLFCKRGFYVPADSMISNLVMGTPFPVSSDQQVTLKSSVIACEALGANQGVPLVYLMAQTEASSDSAFTRFATDSAPGTNAGSWTFTLQNGSGAPLTSVSAIAVPYCYY